MKLWLLRTGLSAAIIFCLCAEPAWSQSSAEQATEALRELSRSDSSTPVGDVNLTTKNRDLEGLGRELNRIYLTLYNSKRLSVRPTFVKEPPSEFSVEQLLRSEGLFYGARLPLGIDNLACDLNPQVCWRERVAVSKDSLPSLTEHVSGYAPSPSRWTIVAPVQLIVPDVRLTPDIEWYTIDKNPKKSLEETVVNELGGCSKFDDPCRNLLRFYNRTLDNRLFDDAYRGPVALPVLTVVVSTNVASVSEVFSSADNPTVRMQEGSITLQRLPQGNQNKSESYKVLKGLEEDRNLGVAVAREKNVVDQLRGNIISRQIFNKFQHAAVPVAGAALFPEDIETYRKELHDLLAVPSALRQFPFPGALAKPIGVGVVDSRIDDKHCAFSIGQITARNASAVPNLGPAAACDLRVTGDQNLDHATHVAGIIASHFGSNASKVPVGLNPYAKVFALEINFAGPNDEFMAKSMRTWIESNDLKVVNMSFGYIISSQNPDLQATDALEQPIAGLQNTTLFVAAAGNAGADKSYVCDLRPACFDMPNVIAVAGIDRDPGKPTLLESDGKQYSNFGRRIHIAAVGKEVFSTLVNGRYGVLTGTSQAAPQVAAVASLMVSKYPMLLPVAIKNRLIYCSDMLDTLRDKLFGGRLNTDCALDGDTGRLQLKGAAQVQNGKLQPNSRFVFKDEDDIEFAVDLQMLRSMSYDPVHDAYTVFYTSRNRPDAPLLRASNLVLKEPLAIMTFTPHGGAAAPIVAGQIKRYVSPVR